MSEYHNIFLTYKEIRILKRYKKAGYLNKLPGADRLIANNFIIAEYKSPTPGDMPVPTGKYYISELGINYLLYRREKIFLKKLPVIISIIALVISIASFLFSIFL